MGLIHIYCGDGKGKTTASIGLLIRAIGSGMKVLFVQFLKSSKTSELNILEKLDSVTILRGKSGNVFSFNMSQEEKDLSKKIHDENLKKAIEMVNKGEYNMLILDEVIGAYNKGLLNKNILMDFLDNKPENLEVVLTGRGPDELLLEKADYVSEIKKVKHPYDKGIKSRIGIER